MLPSIGMKNVLARKFVMPAKVLPPPPEEKRRRMQQNGGVLQKRARPLQPGELERRYYGNDGRGGGFDSDGRGGGGGGGGYGEYDRGYCGNGYAHPENDVAGIGKGGRDGCGHDVKWLGNDSGGCDQINDRRGKLCVRDGDFDGQRQRYPQQELAALASPLQNQYNHHVGACINDRGQNVGCHPTPKSTGGVERNPPGRSNLNGRDVNVTGSRGKTFQSNEYDPSGFYNEEEEDSDDDRGVDCGDDNRVVVDGCGGTSMERNQHVEKWQQQCTDETRMNNNCVGSGHLPASQDQYCEVHSSSRRDEHLLNRIERGQEHIARGVVDYRPLLLTGSRIDDTHSDDELLALLGAGRLPTLTPKEKSTSPQHHSQEPTIEQSDSQVNAIATANSHNNNTNKKVSPLLAGIIEAEEEIHNTLAAAAAAATTTVNDNWNFDVHDSYSDDVFERWPEADDDDDGGGLDDKSEDIGQQMSENVNDNVSHSYNHGLDDKEETGGAAAAHSMTCFTLPSADESTSTEDDDQSDDELWSEIAHIQSLTSSK